MLATPCWRIAADNCGVQVGAEQIGTSTRRYHVFAAGQPGNRVEQTDAMRLDREGEGRYGGRVVRGRQELAGSCCSVGAGESRGKRGREVSWRAEGFREWGPRAVGPEFQLPMSSWNLEEHHDAIQRSSSPRMTEAGAVQPGIPTRISTCVNGSMSIASPSPRRAPLAPSSHAGHRVARQGRMPGHCATLRVMREPIGHGVRGTRPACLLTADASRNSPSPK